MGKAAGGSNNSPTIYGATLGQWAAGAVVILVILVSLWIDDYAPPNWKYVRRKSCHLCGNRCVVVERARWWRVQPTTETLFTNYPIPPGHAHDWWQYDYNYFAPSFRQGGSSDLYKDGSRWP